MAMSDAELGRKMTDASDGVLGTLMPDSERARFPLVARLARDYVRPGLALMGDAAHTVHPLAGQGANLGIADAEVLARVLDDALARREYPADRPVLRRYERARKGHNAVMMHFLTGLNRLFASDSALLGELRRSGMAIFNRSGPLRTGMVAVALGGIAGK
jgi:2-octaprenylphenol hydroxylase